MPLLRYLDVALVAVAAIPALILGAPAFGFAVGGGVWIVQRIIQANERRLTPATMPASKRVTVQLFEAFGRIWLLAGGIVIAGVVGSRRDGLTAAIIIFAAYSIALALRLMSGPPAPRGEEHR